MPQKPIVVDFYTKVISPERKIWLVHPGVYRKYFAQFKSQGIIFIAMPGLDLTKSSLKKTETIRQHIRMAKRWREYIEDQTGKISKPSDFPEKYSKKPGKDVNSDVGNIQAMYQTASPGDLVVVMAKGHYEPFLIGEIETDFNPQDSITLKGMEYAEVQYRRVRWLHTDKYSKRNLNAELAQLLVNRKAIVQLPKDQSTQQLYEIAYSSYVIGEKSKVDIYGHAYTGHNLTATNSSTTLISYLASAYAALEAGKLEKFKSLDIEDAIAAFPTGELIQNFYQDFRSPGKFVLFTSSAALAAFIMLGVTTTTYASVPDDLKTVVNVENSAEGSVDASLEEACGKYNELLSSLGDDKLCAIHELAQEGKEKIDLKTGAKIKKNTSKTSKL